MLSVTWYRRLAIACLLFTFVALVIPGNQLYALSRTLQELLSLEVSLPSPPGGGDKLVHAGLFVACGFFLQAGLFLPQVGWPGRLVMLVGYGALTELVQLAVPGRSASPYDFLADTIGAGLGLGLAWLLSGGVSKQLAPGPP